MMRLLCSSVVATGLLALALTGCEQPADVPRPQVAQASNSLPAGDALRAELDEVLDFTFRRHLEVNVNAAWQIVHGIMAFGPNYHIKVDDRLVPGLEWLLAGGKLRGWNLEPGDVGVRSIMEPGSKMGEGHPNQWLGYLAHCKLPPEQPIMVGDKQYELADMLKQAKWDMRDGEEASWTLMAFSSYLPASESWQARDGQTWNLERIVSFEAKQDLSTSACGGTHRMYALAVARNRYREQNPSQPLSGAWLEAEQKIQECVSKARMFQQPTGAFSANYFDRPGSTPDLQTVIGTTGHTLEFLTVALDDQTLAEPWVTRAAVFLCKILRHTREEQLECGALFHAAHGLHLYRERRFGPRTYSIDSPGKDVKLTSRAAEAQVVGD